MSKIQKSAEELLAGIVSAPVSQNSENPTKKTDTKEIEKRGAKAIMKNPQTLSIVLSGETFTKLFGYVNDKKLQGERGYSMSKICRAIIEDWVDKNI